MDILRKSLAPICDTAWGEINQTATEVLTSVLSARKFMDVDGPKGWEYAALPLGRIGTPADQQGKVKYGINQVLPLVEARVPFELNIWELDNVARGARDTDLDNLEEAARNIARFEEDAIYKGFKNGHIKGLKESSDYAPVGLPEKDEDILGVVSGAMAQMKAASIEGPYSLVLNTNLWQRFNSYGRGYPLRKQIEGLLGGSIIMAPFIDDAYMVSERGGDFKLVIGQDISIGYESHNQKTVQLYFTESFTFQVIEPAAVLVLK